MINKHAMKLCSNIIFQESANAENEHFHFHNSLLCTDDIAFQQKYFKKTPKRMPQIYIPDVIKDNKEDEALNQTRKNLQNKSLLKIAVLIAMKAKTPETTQAIIDSGASCCVTPYLENFLIQPTPIHNTTLKEISGGLTAVGRGTIQLKINKPKNNQSYS
jgi:hypothetical protein